MAISLVEIIISVGATVVAVSPLVIDLMVNRPANGEEKELENLETRLEEIYKSMNLHNKNT